MVILHRSLFVVGFFMLTMFFRDLNKFYEMYDIPSDTTYVEAEGEAGNPTGDNYVEATLDIQYLSAMAPQMESACVNTDNSTDAEGGAGSFSSFCCLSFI